LVDAAMSCTDRLRNNVLSLVDIRLSRDCSTGVLVNNISW